MRLFYCLSGDLVIRKRVFTMVTWRSAGNRILANNHDKQLSNKAQLSRVVVHTKYHRFREQTTATDQDVLRVERNRNQVTILNIEHIHAFYKEAALMDGNRRKENLRTNPSPVGRQY